MHESYRLEIWCKISMKHSLFTCKPETDMSSSTITSGVIGSTVDLVMTVTIYGVL